MKNKVETSKKIIVVSYVIGIILTILTIGGIIYGYDITPLSIITGAVFAEISVSNAFYYNKAKKENLLKIAIGTVNNANTEKVEDIVKIVSALGGIL